MDTVGLNPTGRPRRSSAGTRRKKARKATREELRQAYAEALAKESGSHVFENEGPGWGYLRAIWYRYADAVLKVNEEFDAGE